MEYRELGCDSQPIDTVEVTGEQQIPIYYIPTYHVFLLAWFGNLIIYFILCRDTTPVFLDTYEALFFL